MFTKRQKLLIELIDEGMELVQALIQEAYKVGGIPFFNYKNLKMQRIIIKCYNRANEALCRI